MTAKELIKRLAAEGWTQVSQKGSHAKYVKPGREGHVIVPLHKGDIPTGTLHSILKQAGLK